MLERIDFHQEEEKRRLLPVTVLDTPVDIPSRAEDDFNEVIRALESDQHLKLACYVTPYSLGLIIAMCGIAGIVIAKLSQQNYRMRYGAELADEYNQVNTTAWMPYKCGDFYPLNNVCKNFNFDDSTKPYLDGKYVKNETMFELTTECYYEAKFRCEDPGQFGISTESWPTIILWISSVGLAIACLGTFLHCMLTRYPNTVSQCRESTQHKLAELCDKYSIQFNKNNTIKHAIAVLNENKEQLTRPARRRAFLSSGRSQYYGTSSVASFFNKASPEKPAPKEIKELILHYADLMPKTKLPR